MKKNLLVVFCAVAAILLVCFTTAKKQEAPITYPVVDWTISDGKGDEESVLYIASIDSPVRDADEKLFLHYFKDQNDGENIFLEPVFEDGKCVEERYFTEQNYENYSSADTSEVFEPVFRLAGKTSEEEPAVLLQQDGKLYCIAQGTAYVICTDYRTIPETISVGTLVNSERRIVYQVRCDGSFEPVRSCKSMKGLWLNQSRKNEKITQISCFEGKEKVDNSCKSCYDSSIYRKIRGQANGRNQFYSQHYRKRFRKS